MVIYKIINNINSKIYIGKTTRNPICRWKEHALCQNSNTVSLSAAISKYGVENFSFEILCNCYSVQELDQKEKEYIGLYKSNNKHIGYNLTTGGDGVSGYKVSDTEKAARSERMKGSFNPMLGKKHTPEHIRKMSERFSGKGNPMFGKKRPDLAERNRLRKKQEK